jgi:hypothetical protein
VVEGAMELPGRTEPAFKLEGPVGLIEGIEFGYEFEAATELPDGTA